MLVFVALSMQRLHLPDPTSSALQASMLVFVALSMQLLHGGNHGLEVSTASMLVFVALSMQPFHNVLILRPTRHCFNACFCCSLDATRNIACFALRKKNASMLVFVALSMQPALAGYCENLALVLQCLFLLLSRCN